MTLEETTQLYASVLRQLLPTGGYDTSPNTEALAVDVYAHAKLLAQADLDAKRLLKVLEGFPPDLISEYETEYGLPLKCTVNAGKTLEERIELLKWVRSTRNVLNRAYFDQVLAIFGVELFEFKTFKPMQCTAPCNAPVNTEQLRYKVRIVIPDTAPADMDCIIQNYFPGYLRIDVLKVPLLFKTSKPYPVLLDESIESDFSIGMKGRTVLNETDLSESVNSAFGVQMRITKEIFYRQTSAEENMTSAFAISGIRILKQVEYRSATAETENMTSAFAISGIRVTKEVAYRSTTIETEQLAASFSVGMKII